MARVVSRPCPLEHESQLCASFVSLPLHQTHGLQGRSFTSHHCHTEVIDYHCIHFLYEKKTLHGSLVSDLCVFICVERANRCHPLNEKRACPARSKGNVYSLVNARLLSVGVLSGRLTFEHSCKLGVLLIIVDVNKVLELVWGSGGCLILSLLSLRVLDPGLVLGGGLVVTGADTIGDSLPHVAALHLALGLNCIDRDLLALGAGIPKEFVAATRDRLALVLAHASPFSLNGIECVAASADGGLERVCLAREVTLAGVAERGQETGCGLDVRLTGKLNVWRAVPEALDEQVGEGDEVELLLVAVSELDAENGVSDLLDRDGASGERGLLCAVSFESDAGRLVLDVVSGDGRVMRHLLGSEGGLTTAILVGPLAEEKLTEDGVERLLFGARRDVTSSELTFERADEPLEHEVHALDLILTLGDVGEFVRVLAPVGGEFDERYWRKDERRSRERRKVTGEGGDRLEELTPSLSLLLGDGTTDLFFTHDD